MLSRTQSRAMNALIEDEVNDAHAGLDRDFKTRRSSTTSAPTDKHPRGDHDVRAGRESRVKVKSPTFP